MPPRVDFHNEGNRIRMQDLQYQYYMDLKFMLNAKQRYPLFKIALCEE